ncbi:hypothetical protein LTR95_006184 [Oleoguttula sp. CCFEE 5521]
MSSDTDLDSRGGLQGYYPAPHSIDPLPRDIHYGLIVVGLCGLASFLSTLTLFTFLVYRFVSWRSHYKTFIGYNQYIVLFLNLVFADLLQATAFLISFYWIQRDAILAPTNACTAQGFMLHFGDVASAFFVLSIAIHTYTTAALGHRIQYNMFALGIGICWAMALLLTVLGPAMYGRKYFVRAGAWCWVSNDYETERLALHYVWLFLAEFGLVIIYLLTFFSLRRKTHRLFADQASSGSVPNQTTIRAVNRITKLMMLYPIVYVTLTIPISSVRMWSMAHHGQSVADVTACTVGALLASCGWVDSLLYTLTRKRLLQETMGAGATARSGDNNVSGGAKGTQNSILQTMTYTVRSHSMEIASPSQKQHQRGSFISGEAKEMGFAERESARRTRNKSVGVVSEHTVETRTPSPSGSVDPIINGVGERGGMRRMLSSGRKEAGLDDSYEMRSMGGKPDWRGSR